MAEKKKTPSKSKKEAGEDTKVTRIKATDTRSTGAKKQATVKKDTKSTSKEPAKVSTSRKEQQEPRKNPIVAFGGYFKGAWDELRQVRWPNRRTTWGLTLAVIIFTVFFVVLIVVLDYAFQWIFDKVLLG